MFLVLKDGRDFVNKYLELSGIILVPALKQRVLLKEAAIVMLRKCQHSLILPHT